MQITQFGLSDAEIADLENQQGQQLSKKVKSRYRFLHTRQTLSAKDIADLEKLIASSLPIQYKSFLAKHNGGKPDKYILNDEKVINYFFGYFANPNVDMSIEWHLSVYSNRYPNTMLPIASAGGGDLILLGLAGRYENKIYYWDHNTESEDDGESYDDNVSFVANSLNDFLGLLKDDE